MLEDQDTIVAVSTPPGRGGIGVVRVSGARAREVVAPMLRLRHPLAAGRVRFGAVLDAEGEVLDEVVVTWFVAPHSYTSEDVIEIACHGSPVLLDWVLRGCIGNGARLAEPGEFTRRAFLSGRLDLTQAEAVDDLVQSSTLEQARLAARQMGGALSRSVAPMKQRLVELIATLEAGIDFAEDDIDLMPQAEIVQRIGEVEAETARLAGTFAYGRVLREGFTLAIVGRPNAGKSSLFNRLLERERAIVTAAPGTTRDPISERLSLNGIPVELIDTAGLRDAPQGIEGEAESQGIARTRTLMAEADVVLLVLDASRYGAVEALDAEDAAILAELEGRNAVVAWNKSDLVEGLAAVNGVATSALTGEGIDELRRAIVARLAAPVGESALVTSVRQHTALTAALAALRAAEAAVTQQTPHEMLLLDLYATLQALDTLTGATTTDDVLALIFSTFCIGK
ncbi:tRNA uridine-5-carboxymethylaminomethyl(34) synthesis GTPase MnmE [Granulicella sp. WH15]|uniref:tRNA uridine-5-carboxymethylaminomethyl(34) synthesis GTPase MnmE n=1 Tax=Granulicella sp. WH15 TaxID=2602070 RepID=UPI001366E258|nr:tRNA uridine-5-carboxymethylaminomethyl(34) synthesis GTPase MnmE [Granulicella sp. WH15]QHN05230.1 tRNA uridine-5-carboxymethylaminomethyl(34) synthesis GTPase MnmE [Granulicella sp. WH15]